MFKKSLIAAIAAVTIAASMASPAQALSKNGAVFLGLGLGTMAAIAAANAHGHDGYRERGYGHRGRAYHRAARKCAYRYGHGTWKWERCMDRRGF